ncbi:hypothetical protein BLA29_015036 [Euroglyphus maynei]|uniref:Uncharacterized protein n=1 Tax=Euroglyphus maynei TaxID=6958 RepID=A0A1Y3BQE5_EURMA|nr:hypothetical protein BLA29_015036 [Euroglyphus maynei]
MAYGSEMVGKVEQPPSSQPTPNLSSFQSSFQSLSSPLRSMNHENKSILHRFGSENNNGILLGVKNFDF